MANATLEMMQEIEMAAEAVVASYEDQVQDLRQQLGDHLQRSEERRVGKECRSRWSPYH